MSALGQKRMSKLGGKRVRSTLRNGKSATLECRSGGTPPCKNRLDRLSTSGDDNVKSLIRAARCGSDGAGRLRYAS